MSLAIEQTPRAYAAMINTLDLSYLQILLADDFHCAPKWVFAEVEYKRNCLEYIAPKLEAIRKFASKAYSGMGWLECEIPCP